MLQKHYKIKKPIDKIKKMWYNKYVIKRKEHQAILQKDYKIKKGIDKIKKVWYNKYVR